MVMQLSPIRVGDVKVVSVLTSLQGPCQSTFFHRWGTNTLPEVRMGPKRETAATWTSFPEAWPSLCPSGV